MNAEEIIGLEKKYIMQTYGRFDIVLDYGKGCYVYDKNGKKYLDFVGALATNSIGYSNKKISKALYEQSKKLINTTNLFYTEQQAILAEKLAKLSGLDKCFFSNSGSEAVETAIKLARKFSRKKGIISTEYGFHGRTLGALSATWKKEYKESFEPLVPGFKHVKYNDINAIKNAIDIETAAVIIEPIQGEAGIIVPDEGYLKGVSEVCKKKKVLLIIDEIQTNLRTGKFFAYQNEGIIPDIMTVAKGIGGGVPIGVTIAKEEVANAFQKGDQGSTFGGNPLSCAAANSSIDFVIEKKLVEKAAKNGSYFLKELNKLKDRHPIIKEVRGKGLMIAIEFSENVKDKLKNCIDKGLLVNCIGETIFRFLPPLTVNKKEIDFAINVLDEVLKS